MSYARWGKPDRHGRGLRSDVYIFDTNWGIETWVIDGRQLLNRTVRGCVRRLKKLEQEGVVIPDGTIEEIRTDKYLRWLFIGWWYSAIRFRIRSFLKRR